ncbi:hypothetical protein KVR01_010322 [Diaporthe batatas]|uniref:uncharacterized protein n=1 Tax=Diaporthe batatas TaxID=748121 RepID=UPI001D03F1C4|nr:uncharacterized protein KVR01_010322 [Diaporthe batatas]KAG8159685.1 hypothetical protein KVR01_010322 [Diaporthe batatas]
MSSALRTISAIAAAAVSVNAAMGPAFSTGPVADSTFIRESTATLVLPDVPSNNQGDASLWVGMGTSNGDLIQSISDNYKSDTWSIFAYTLVSLGEGKGQTVVQDDTPTQAHPGDEVTMHYKLDDASGNYTQTVSINGEVVSTLSTSSGKAQGWGSAVECAAEDCGTVPAHKWTDAKIILDSADASYDRTMYLGEGVTGDMTTSDGGKTWEIGTFEIPEFTFGA